MVIIYSDTTFTVKFLLTYMEEEASLKYPPLLPFTDVISSLMCLKIIPFPYLIDTFIDISLNYWSFWSLILLEFPVKNSPQKELTVRYQYIF